MSNESITYLRIKYELALNILDVITKINPLNYDKLDDKYAAESFELAGNYNLYKDDIYSLTSYVYKVFSKWYFQKNIPNKTDKVWRAIANELKKL